MSTAMKPWMVLAIIFVAGALSGAALTFVLASQAHRPPPMAQIEKRIMWRITSELTLTTDQQSKLQPIIADASKEIQDVHHDEIERISGIIKKTNDQMTPILTADQKAKLDKLEAEGDNMFFGRMKGWGPSGDHFHGGPGGPDGHGWPGGPDGDRGGGPPEGGPAPPPNGPPPGPSPDENAPRPPPASGNSGAPPK